MTNVKFIAEISSNHQRDLDRCFRFIETAARVGCYAVKFQLFKINQMFSSDVLSRSEKHRKRKAWELPLAFIPELKNCCEQNNIKFSCTPFYLDAVDELEPYVDFFKIASYELLWPDLINECCSTNKPLMLSTGMATMQEIDSAVDWVRNTHDVDLALLHCVSSYPSPVEESNLAVLSTLRERYSCTVGWSDHSVSEAVIYRSVHKWAAEIIEFHLDLDTQGEEYRFGHCWLPDQIEKVIDNTKLGMLADGSDEKQPTKSESDERNWRADPSDGLRPLKVIREDRL